MSNPTISFDPPPDATPEAELEVLATIYSFLIQGRENRKAAASGGCASNKGGESVQSKGPSGSGAPPSRDRREEGSDKPPERGKEVNTK
jgi:hypothetical protein